jgi:hypothetical protein
MDYLSSGSEPNRLAGKWFDRNGGNEATYRSRGVRVSTGRSDFSLLFLLSPSLARGSKGIR